MKILSVIASADIGGAEVHLEHVVRFALAEHTIVALADGPMIRRWRAAGAIVFTLPVRSKSPIGAIGEFERIVASSGADLAHSHTPKASLLAAMCRLRVPHVMTIHGSHRQFATSRTLPASWYMWADRWSSRRSDRVIAVCESDSREFAAAGFEAAKLVVVPNGVPDPGVFGENAARITPPGDIVWIGRLSPEKRPQLMIEIARMIGPHPRVNAIRIIGDGDLRSEVRAHAIPGVVFSDHVGSLTDVWQSAAVLVNTSLSEGASLVIIEALAAGVPVVASAVGGSREILANAGFVVADKETPQATAGVFASIIKRLLEDEPHRREIVALGRRRYLERYSASAMAERLVAIYRSVAPRAGGVR